LKATEKDQNAKAWRGGKDGYITVRTAPDAIVEVPLGWELDALNFNAPLADLAAAHRDLLQAACAFDDVPVGTLLPTARAASGVQLVQERAPLEQARADRVAALRDSAVRVLEVLRHVWNAYQTGDGTRLRGVYARFVPDSQPTPIDPETASRLNVARLSNRLTSRAHIIAKEEGITIEEADAKVAEIDARDGAMRQAQGLGARTIVPPSILSQARDRVAADDAEA
jgi:hypothetical protein